MKRSGLILFAVILMLAAALGCQRRPLDYYYRPTCRVILKVDWSNFPETPSGMTAYFYRDGDDAPTVFTTADVHYAELELKAGHYKGFVINQSPDEFWTFGFNRMNSWNEANASLAMTRTKWYQSKTTSRDGVDENAVALAPENLGVAQLEEFDITDEMVERYQAQYADWRTKTKAYDTKVKANASTKSLEDDMNNARAMLDELTVVISTVAYNVISELRVRVYVDGIYNLYSARASMTGLASDYIFSRSRNGDESTVQLLESETWRKTVSDTDPTRGYIESKITTLGLPGITGPISYRDPDLNIFGLSCLLVDLSTQKDNDFPVGNRFTVENGVSGLKLVLNLNLGTLDEPAIALPDVPPYGGTGSGFDATVDDWEEGETVEIPM